MLVWRAIDAVTDRFSASLVTTLTWEGVVLSEGECHIKRPSGWVEVSQAICAAVLTLREWNLGGDTSRTLGENDPLLPEFPGSSTPMNRVWMRTLVRVAREAPDKMTDDLVTRSARFRQWLIASDAARPDQKTRAVLRHLLGLQTAPGLLRSWNTFQGIPDNFAPLRSLAEAAPVAVEGLVRYLPAFREALDVEGIPPSTTSRWIAQARAAIQGDGPADAQGVLRFRSYLASLPQMNETMPPIPPTPAPPPFVLGPPPVVAVRPAPTPPPKFDRPIPAAFPPPPAVLTPATPQTMPQTMPPLVPFLDRQTLERAATSRDTLIFGPRGMYVLDSETNIGRQLRPEEAAHLRSWVAWANNLADTTDMTLIAWVKAQPKAPTFGDWTEWHILTLDGSKHAVD